MVMIDHETAQQKILAHTAPSQHAPQLWTTSTVAAASNWAIYECVVAP